MTDFLLESSLPVFQVDGAVAGDLSRDLRYLDIEETTAGLKTLAACFIGHGPKSGQEQEGQLYLDGELLDFGKPLKVSIGPEGGDFTVFDGLISGIEASFQEGMEPEVRVFAEDRLMKLRMTRRFKTYEKATDDDVVSAIAGEHGMTPESDAGDPQYDVIQQWNMSDLAFLRERASLINAEIWAEGTKLCFKPRTKRAGNNITLVRGNHTLALEVRADLAHQRGTVKVSGYDAQARGKIDEDAGASVVAEETSGGRTGPSVLTNAFGDCVSYRVREVPLADGEARGYARAEMLRRARAFVTAVGVTRGTPDMVVGSKITLDNAGAPFDGDGYYATRVRHTYDIRQGHRTHFEAERATLREGT